MPQTDPVLVEVTRGAAVESVHRGAFAVVNASGRIVEAGGDAGRPVYPRSAIKPLQAVPLMTSGAGAAFELSRAEIALACASHNGEAVHTETVAQWLQRLGYEAGTLECGAHPPRDRPTRQALLARGDAPSALHNNCSGKHAGFLTIARHLGVDPAGYIRPEHAAQQLVRDTVAALTGCDLARETPAVDGCGIPVYRIPLRGLALAMARFAAPADLDARTAGAIETVRDAMLAHPYLVAGRDRFCTVLMQTLSPNVLVKTGAEGVFCAAVLDQGLGIALKIDDGATRASEVALGAVLRRLGAIDDEQFHGLRAKLEPAVTNVAGAEVGVIRAARAAA